MDSSLDAEAIGETQDYFSQTQQVVSQRETQKKSQTDTFAVLIPSNPKSGLTRFELKRADINRPHVFGRQATKCDYVLTDKKVSSKHCQIWVVDPHTASGQDGRILIEDLSTNGTYVEGTKLGKGKRTQLDSGFEICFGPPSTDLTQDLRFIFRTTPKGSTSSQIDPNTAGGLYVQYDVRDTIGKGSFATVKRAIERSTGNLKAIKIMQKKRFMSNPKTFAMLEREVEIMKALDHPHIARYQDYFEDEDMMYIVMEYIDGGDLLDYTIRSNGLNEQTSAEIARQICLAVDYLHRSGVCHRDLKPDNVLLTNGDSPICKISDFGLAKLVDNKTFLRTACGTPTYLAPEVVLQQNQSGYSFAVDAWSVGVIVYAILSNASPFDENSEESLADRMKRRQPDMALLRNLGISRAGCDFVQRLMTVDPKARMTVGDALAHPWLKAAATRIESSGSLSLLPPNKAQDKCNVSSTVPVIAPSMTSTNASHAKDNNSIDSTDPYSQKLYHLNLNGSTSSSAPLNGNYAEVNNELEVEDSAPFGLDIKSPLKSPSNGLRVDQNTPQSNLPTKRKTRPSSAFSTSSDLSAASDDEATNYTTNTPATTNLCDDVRMDGEVTPAKSKLRQSARSSASTSRKQPSKKKASPIVSEDNGNRRQSARIKKLRAA